MVFVENAGASYILIVLITFNLAGLGIVRSGSRSKVFFTLRKDWAEPTVRATYTGSLY